MLQLDDCGHSVRVILFHLYVLLWVKSPKDYELISKCIDLIYSQKLPEIVSEH